MYVSLEPCNRVCCHCKALFWFERGSQSPATAEGPPSTPPTGNIPQASTPVTVEGASAVQNQPQMIEGTKPSVPKQVLKNDVQEETSTTVSTPPTGGILEASTPVTTKTKLVYTSRLKKIKGARTSVRRQLLKDDAQEEMGTAAKKTNQG